MRVCTFGCQRPWISATMCWNFMLTYDIHVESDMWCSLDEDSLVVPFWLKAVNFSKSHHRGGGHREWWSGQVRILRKRPLFCRCSPLSWPSLSLRDLSGVWFVRVRPRKPPTRASAFASWERAHEGFALPHLHGPNGGRVAGDNHAPGSPSMGGYWRKVGSCSAAGPGKPTKGARDRAHP